MWVNQGVIFSDHHAQLPTVLAFEDYLRIYYSTKSNNISLIRYIDVDIDNPKQIIYKSDNVVSPGKGFDDCGVMPSSISDGLLYYTGWHQADTRYEHAIGAVRLSDYERVSETPLLREDNIIVNSAWVDGNYNVYYCRGTGWLGNHPCYGIAKTKKWLPGEMLFGEHNEACSRPCLFEGKIYFSYKTFCPDNNYQLAYYYDGTRYKLKIPRCKADSDMQCYPCLYRHKNVIYMFYNGNGYGATGILWAVHENF